MLIARCPRLYRDFDPRLFHIGDGWYTALLEASEWIEHYLGEHQGELDVGEPLVDAVREKYGSLRLELNISHPALEQITLELEERPERTCELCGEPGNIIETGLGWLTTRCANCVRPRHQ